MPTAPIEPFEAGEAESTTLRLVSSVGRQANPDAIAATYLSVLAQPRNAWTWEIELRPWVESF